MHQFGGPDTPRKLDCLQQYLTAYTTALQNMPFKRLYVDAFAGSGTRAEVKAALPLLGGDAEVVTTPGSAKIALEVEPAFDAVILIEQDIERVEQLKQISAGHSHVFVKQGDANDVVQKLCERVSWKNASYSEEGVRGVVFLDPYGMEVSWSTVEAIAKTEALDCWYFFPLSGLYRNAPHDPTRLDEGKQASLDRVLGARDWREKWYRPVPQTHLFEDEHHATRRHDVDSIENYVAERLRSVFRGGVLPPLRLHHKGRSRAPMASLFFAIANPNPKAVRLARRIAAHILAEGYSSQSRS